MLDEHLKKLDSLIDPDHAARSEELLLAAASYEPVERLPVVMTCPVDGWPAYSYRETFHDMAKMLANEFAAVWIAAHVRDDRACMVRANYGVGTVASMFGCRIEITDEDIMPWCHPLGDRALDAVLEAGAVDVESGLGSRVIETERFYIEALSKFDNLARCVHIYCCDTQGPFDIAHLVMGHRMYTEVYDNPERVHRLLDLTTDAHIRFTKLQREIIGESDGYAFHSQWKIPAPGRLCDDSSINLRAELYDEFCRPYNERAFGQYGGGWIHYCGSGRQILPGVLETRGVRGVNFGNSEMQDIDSIYRQAALRKIAILGWPRHLGLPQDATTGVILTANVASLDEARRQ